LCQPLFVRVSQHPECYLMILPFWACNKHNVICDGSHKTMTDITEQSQVRSPPTCYLKPRLNFRTAVTSSSEEMVITVTHIISRMHTGFIVTITEILFTASVTWSWGWQYGDRDKMIWW
jgi:hypothetical protein